MHVTDLEGNEYALQATTINEYELSGNQSLSFNILPSKTNKLFMESLTEMWKVTDHDDVEHKIVYFKRQGKGDKQTIEIQAVPLFFDDMDRQRIYERYDRHMTAYFCFNLIFEDSGYNFILNGDFDSIQWEGFAEGDTRLTMFQDALNRYKAEFRISGNTIYIEKIIGRDTQFMYRHRLNASDIVLEHDATNFYTYAKGYGDYGDGEGGEDWQNAKVIREYTSPIARIMGKREAPPIKNGNITTEATMDEQLKILVDESLKISVSATIHDLRKQGYALAQPEMGDRVFLIDERIGLNDEVRVVDMKLERNWKGEVINIDLTFGTPGLVKRHQSNLESSIKNITDLLDGKIKLPFSVYEARMQEVIKAMNSALTQLTVLDDGSLAAIDPDNPNYMVMLKSTGLFLSEDGGATPKQAIYGGGINASVISAGTMLADRIAGGILTSLNRNTFFNLNTGELEMAQANFTLGGGARINFTSVNNRIQFRSTDDGVTRSSGFGVGRSLSGFPFAYSGTTGSSNLDTLSPYWSGAIWNTTRAITDGASNSISGFRFQFRAQAVDWDRGIEIDFNGSPTIRPINGAAYNYNLGNSDNLFNNLHIRQLYTVGGFNIRNNSVNDIGWRLSTIQESGRVSLRGLNMGAYNYDIGSSESYNAFYFGYISHLRPSPSDSGSGVGSSDRPYRWGHIQSLTSENVYADRVNGTVVGTSSKNAKMEIEDVDRKQAFDYVDMMDIKSFFYKDSDITNKYNRKVSPIIEQLDPVLENLYKATEEGLDINSNLFLLAQAFKYYVNKTDDRLEMLEDGISTNKTA